MSRGASGANPPRRGGQAHGHGRDRAENKLERKASVLDRAAAKAEQAAAKLAHGAAQIDQLSAQLANLDLWTRPEPGARRPRFTRDEIAEAAVRIADTEGFAALSMRRLAVELDAGTMTLYHYVRTKDELLSLVNDAVMAEVIVPDGRLPTDWRAALTMIARRSRDSILRHPWVLDLRDEPAPGPNSVRHFDQSLQAVAGLDVPVGDKAELVMAVDEYVFGYCFVERADTAGEQRAVIRSMLSYIDSLIDNLGLSALAAVRDAHGLDGGYELIGKQLRDPGRFDRNLARLLDGFSRTLP